MSAKGKSGTPSDDYFLQWHPNEGLNPVPPALRDGSSTSIADKLTRSQKSDIATYLTKYHRPIEKLEQDLIALDTDGIMRKDNKDGIIGVFPPDMTESQVLAYERIGVFPPDMTESQVLASWVGWKYGEEWNPVPPPWRSWTIGNEVKVTLWRHLVEVDCKLSASMLHAW